MNRCEYGKAQQAPCGSHHHWIAVC